MLSNFVAPQTVQHSDELLAIILKLLKPSGLFILNDEADLNSTLKLNGFVNVTKNSDNCYVAEKPKFEVSFVFALCWLCRPTLMLFVLYGFTSASLH